MFIFLILAYAWPLLASKQLSSPANCPANCLCVDSSVVCSCEDALGGIHGKEFRLPHFGGIQFIDSLVIHSCDKVLIPNDTFDGTAIQHTIKIIGVRNLELSSWAFRGLRKAPEQVIMQATTMTYCPAHAFSGLSNAKHIWFRNSTVGTLATGAFSGVTNVDYIYFRDSSIQHLEKGAFGFMSRIQHFFVRGNITVHSAGSALFLNSTVEEVIFEQVHFTAPVGFFDGLEAASIQVIGCSWKSMENSWKFQNLPQKVVRFSINNSTVDQLAMTTFRNTAMLHISHSTVCNFTVIGSSDDQSVNSIAKTRNESIVETEWDPALATTSSPELKVQKIEITETAIQTIAAGAFKNMQNFKNLEISRCRIAAVEANAFQNSQFHNIRIQRTHIDKLFGDAFAALSVDVFFCNECDIGLIEGSAFREASIGTISFSRCHITNIARHSFSGLEIKEFVLDKTKIYRCEQNPFFDAKIRNLTVSGTEIVTGAFGDVFQNLRATYFQARNNLFDCNVMHCDTNSLLLSEQASWDLPWHFQANRCAKQKICRQPPEWTFHGVICKSFRFLVQCICTNSKFARVPDINASILIIGDCGTLEIDLGRNDRISSLYVFRTESLKIGKMPRNLQIFEIYHSKVTIYHVRAFSELKMEKIEAISTQFEFIANFSFANFQLSDFVLRSSTLNYVEPLAFSNSSISALRAEKSNFLYVTDFWQHFGNVTLIQTFINLPHFLLDAPGNLCMKKVVVACECLAQELGLRNDCDNMPPVCSPRQGAMGCLTEGKLISRTLMPQSSKKLVLTVFFMLNLYFRSIVY